MQSQITTSLQTERASAQWVFQVPFESLRDNFASFRLGHWWRFVFYVLLSHFVSLAQVFCTSCFLTFDIFKFLLWFVTLKALPCSSQHRCPVHPPTSSSRVRAGDRLQQSSHIFHKRLSPCRGRDVKVCGVGTASFAIFILTFFLSSKGLYSVHILQRLKSFPLTSFSLYQTHTHTAEPPTSSVLKCRVWQ